ncbi:MAG: hypothetical protein IJQ50_04320, partial [Clostridia bacterium]|nr:hypothetical protein [Clostridia bacterium]
GNLMLKGKENSMIYNWQNTFDREIVNKYYANIPDDEIYKTVGWRKSYGFPFSAMAYLKETEPRITEKFDVMCMSIEYLNYRLTGKWGITRSMGTPFFMIEQEKGKYYKPFLDAIGITEDKLPPIMENYSVLGNLTDDAALKTGLTANTKVVLGTFDHPAAARGAGVFEENEVLLSCGTSWVALIPFNTREKPIKKNMLVDPFMYPYGNWCGMKSLTSIAEKIEACKKKYFGEISYKDFDELVAKSGFGANGLSIDVDDPCDLPSDVCQCCIARAISEAAAIKLRDMLEELNVQAKSIRIVGGITNSKEWLSVISEICDTKVEVVNGECAGAAGAALMAGVGAKIFKSERV